MSYKRKKLFIVVTSPFKERDFYRYGINTFINNGFQIKVLDLHSLLYNGIISSKISILAQKDIIVHVKTWDELFKMFRTGLNESIVYTTTALTYKSYPFYRMLKKLNSPYIVNSVSVIPTLERNVKYSVLNRLFPITLEKICNFLLRKLPLALSRLSPAYAVIAHGVKSNMNRKEVVKKQEYELTEYINKIRIAIIAVIGLNEILLIYRYILYVKLMRERYLAVDKDNLFSTGLWWQLFLEFIVLGVCIPPYTEGVIKGDMLFGTYMYSYDSIVNLFQIFKIYNQIFNS
jgi:hypothetical protein